MSKFTAGKWEYDTHSIKAVTPEETISIAFMYQPNSKEEAQANARLIAAAPEMYGLLKEELIPTSDYGGILSFSREAKIRAVLAYIDGKEEITAHEGTD